MDPRTEEAVRWLLASAEPAVRYLARRDLLHQPADVDARHVLDGAMVTALLSGQRPDGGFGGHPYRKWTGAFWRLISLVELAVPPMDDRAVAAAHHVLDWLTGEDRGLHEYGRWSAGAYWWTHAGRPSHQEIVDWGRSGPNEMITLNALRVLSTAGRLAPYGDHRAP